MLTFVRHPEEGMSAGQADVVRQKHGIQSKHHSKRKSAAKRLSPRLREWASLDASLSRQGAKRFAQYRRRLPHPNRCQVTAGSADGSINNGVTVTLASGWVKQINKPEMEPSVRGNRIAVGRVQVGGII